MNPIRTYNGAAAGVAIQFHGTERDQRRRMALPPYTTEILTPSLSCFPRVHETVS